MTKRKTSHPVTSYEDVKHTPLVDCVLYNEALYTLFRIVSTIMEDNFNASFILAKSSVKFLHFKRK